jgi:hypothetical protein
VCCSAGSRLSAGRWLWLPGLKQGVRILFFPSSSKRFLLLKTFCPNFTKRCNRGGLHTLVWRVRLEMCRLFVCTAVAYLRSTSSSRSVERWRKKKETKTCNVQLLIVGLPMSIVGGLPRIVVKTLAAYAYDYGDLTRRRKWGTLRDLVLSPSQSSQQFAAKKEGKDARCLVQR